MANSLRYSILVAFPLLLLASDLSSVSQPPSTAYADQQLHKKKSDPIVHPQSKQFSGGVVDPTSLGRGFHISFCSSCSYKKTALEMRTLLLNFFPGSNVALSNYPPPLPKRLLIKVVPIARVAGLALVIAGDYIFPRLGYASPPSWYDSVQRNRIGAAIAVWVMSNVLQNTLQSTGAFEVYYDGDLIFSKLKEGRFPAEFELRELASKIQEVKGALE